MGKPLYKEQFCFFFFLKKISLSLKKKRKKKKRRRRRRRRRKTSNLPVVTGSQRAGLTSSFRAVLLYPCLINSHSKNLSNIHGCGVVLKVSDMSLHFEVSQVSFHSRSSDKGSSSISLSSSNSGL